MGTTNPRQPDEIKDGGTDSQGVGPVQGTPTPQPQVNKEGHRPDPNEPGHPNAAVPPVPLDKDGKPQEGQMPAEDPEVKSVDDLIGPDGSKVDATTHPPE